MNYFHHHALLSFKQARFRVSLVCIVIGDPSESRLQTRRLHISALSSTHLNNSCIWQLISKFITGLHTLTITQYHVNNQWYERWSLDNYETFNPIQILLIRILKPLIGNLFNLLHLLFYLRVTFEIFLNIHVGRLKPTCCILKVHNYFIWTDFYTIILHIVILFDL